MNVWKNNLKTIAHLFDPLNEADVTPGEQGDAECFVHTFARVLRFNTETCLWHIWNGQYWNEDKGSFDIPMFVKYMNDLRLKAANAYVRKNKRKKMETDSNDPLIERLEHEASLLQTHHKRIIGCRKSAVINNIIRLAQSEPQMKTLASWWNRNRDLLATPNGVINLATGEFRPGKQEDFISRASPVEYNPHAKCPRFDQFIGEILTGPEEVRAMQKFLGYCITGHVTSQGIAFMRGQGENGKSKLLDVLSEILGPELSWRLNMSSLTEKARNHIPADVAALIGKRIAIAAETGEGQSIDVAKLKTLSGEEMISGRNLFENFINFRAEMKLILSVNHLPVAKDSSRGFWRRCFIWDFPVNFGAPGAKRDSDIMDKLRGEYAGILNWLVAGALIWKAEGLVKTKRQEEAVQEYRDDNDEVKRFLEENFIVGEPNSRVLVRDMNTALEDWRKRNKKSDFSDAELHARLRQFGCEKKQLGQARAWNWLNILERGKRPDGEPEWSTAPESEG